MQEQLHQWELKFSYTMGVGGCLCKVYDVAAKYTVALSGNQWASLAIG